MQTGANVTHKALKRRSSDAAKRAFGDDWVADGWAIAPGRIELIGNHLDYNGGPVLAGAIDRVIAIGSGPAPSPRAITLLTADVTRKPAPVDPTTLGDWHAAPRDRGPVVYLKGILASLTSRDIPFRTGVTLAVAGDIPRGFGVSSSAALCLATILALTIDDLDPREMVAIAREAEHRAGSPVGAMDQSASVAGDVILFDGRDDSFSKITPHLGNHAFAIASSGVDRSLRHSSYGTRVQETETARKQIEAAYGLDLPTLAAVEPHWDEIAPSFPDHLDPTLIKRVRHVVTETRRVREAVAAIERDDWGHFGELMNASGDSSAGDYEISHPKVEELVAILRRQDGVLGARMMGGGEGGPALALLDRDASESVAAALDRDFYAAQKLKAKHGAPFQLCAFGPGAHRE